MRVAVIGAGGIGGLYGGVLARAGHSVSFLARGPHLAAIQHHGLRVQSTDFGDFSVQAQASANAADFGPADLVLFAVKTYDLEDAAQQTRHVLTPDTSVITFQNGVDAPDQLARLIGEDHVLIGTTRLETTVLEPGVIGHLSPGHLVTVSGYSGPPTPRVEAVADTLKAAGIRVQVAPDGHRALWEKASLLIPMSTITSVCRASFGPIRDLSDTRELTVTLFAEVRAVAAAYGFDLTDPRGGPPGLTLESAPATMTTSMARDFERGRRTELDALAGALVRLADARGVPVPATRTAYAILKLRAQQASAPAKRLGIAAATG
jgi:2-dehydropantoate 2-reductase